MPVHPESRQQTAFITPFGKYQFLTMPFGLVGAPAVFQRLMNTVLADVSAFSTACIDDVPIFSNSWKDHLEHLNEVLNRLKRAGLTLKANKCWLEFQECQYLGHVIGNARVRLEPNKIKAVQNFERPKKKKDVRAFLYLAGYYRKFIPRFSATVIPLTDATKKDAPDKLQWTSSMEAAFQQLKQLASDVVLASPNEECTFILQTDTSSVGIAGNLSQADDSTIDQSPTLAESFYRESNAIQLWSWNALPLIAVYNTFECISQVWNLQCRQTTNVYTTFIGLKDENSRLTWWALALQPHDFRVQHRPEKTNADGLSRKAWTEDAECRRRGEKCQGATPSTLVSRAP